MGKVFNQIPRKCSRCEKQYLLEILKNFAHFWGWIPYFQRFIPSFSSKLSVDLIGKNKHFRWTDETENCFLDLKAAFLEPPILKICDDFNDMILSTNASGFALGWVLEQYDDAGILRPVAY